jgi:hypothetical protein
MNMSRRAAARIERRYWRLHALRVLPNSFSDLLIPVLFRHQHGARPGTRGGRVDLLSVLRFIPIGVFDDATVRTIGMAFGAACKELKDTGQPDVVHEVMIKRIIAAARRGERNVTRLRDAAPTVARDECDVGLGDDTPRAGHGLFRTERARSTSQECFCSNEIAELRHRDASQSERRRVAAQGYPLQCAEGITGRECARPSGDQRVHRNPVTLVTPTVRYPVPS